MARSGRAAFLKTQQLCAEINSIYLDGRTPISAEYVLNQMSITDREKAGVLLFLGGFAYREIGEKIKTKTGNRPLGKEGVRMLVLKVFCRIRRLDWLLNQALSCPELAVFFERQYFIEERHNWNLRTQSWSKTWHLQAGHRILGFRRK